MTPTDIPELVRRLRDYQPTLTEGMIIHSREPVEQAAEILWAMAADLAMTTDYKDGEIKRLREALEQIAALGSDGEHSGDRHARCRDIARQALAAKGDSRG